MRLLILVAALAMATLAGCGDDTSAAADMSTLPYDCGLCGHPPPDLKKGD